MLEIFDSICILLAKAEQKHFQYMKKMLEEKNLRVTPAQIVVLYSLYKQDGVSLTELSKKTFLDNSTLTGLVDRMERTGLVSREATPDDRRSYSIYLTQQANTIREAVIACMDSVAQNMLSGCSPEEIETFRKILLNIYRKL